MNKLLFFTYADKNYDFFAVPYVYFSLISNPQSLVEICLEDHEGFMLKNREGIEFLSGLFPDRFLFRQSEIVKNFSKCIPNTVRFVETPKLTAEYLYIGDIDILIFDDVLDCHLALIEKYGLSFSNIIREFSLTSGKPRLSGLHFCEYSKYYPLPDIEDIDLSLENDEHVLYLIMQRKGLMVPSDFTIRPELGIHLSLNRDPLGRTTGSQSETFTSERSKTLAWGGRGYWHKYEQRSKSESFLMLLPHFDLIFRQLLLILDSIVFQRSRELHIAASAYMLDKRLLCNEIEFSSLHVFYKVRSALIDRKNYGAALAMGSDSLVLWPFNVDVWFKQAWLYMAVGDVARSVECLAYILKLPGGLDFLNSGDFIKNNYSKFSREPVFNKEISGVLSS